MCKVLQQFPQFTQETLVCMLVDTFSHRMCLHFVNRSPRSEKSPAFTTSDPSTCMLKQSSAHHDVTEGSDSRLMLPRDSRLQKCFCNRVYTEGCCSNVIYRICWIIMLPSLLHQSGRKNKNLENQDNTRRDLVGK